MPCLKLPDPPVLSIHYTDVIYYGKNLYDYFLREFGKNPLEPIRKCPYVPSIVKAGKNDGSSD